MLSKVLSLSHSVVGRDDVGGGDIGETKEREYAYDRFSSFVVPINWTIRRGKHLTRCCPLLLMLTPALQWECTVYLYKFMVSPPESTSFAARFRGVFARAVECSRGSHRNLPQIQRPGADREYATTRGGH